MLRVTFNMGFFCCCVVRLNDIVNYFNQHRCLPNVVDSSQQFAFYKQHPQQDITYNFFAQDGNPQNITYTSDVKMFITPDDIEFPSYKNINYTGLAPFVSKYFSPSPMIKERILHLENKYHLDYDKTCLVYYRGNDKQQEAYCPPYQEIVFKANQLRTQHPNLRFIVQTDEVEFLNYFTSRMPNSSSLDEVKAIKKQNANPGLIIPVDQREDFCSAFLANIYFLSRCKHIITTTGHVAFWICLLHGSSDGIHQYRNPKPPSLRYITYTPPRLQNIKVGDYWIE